MSRPAGHIRERSPGSWEIRYQHLDPRTGKRHTATATIRGKRKDAERELRRRLSAVDDGDHVTPDKITLRAWAEHWILIGCPGQGRKKVGQLSQVRYARCSGCTFCRCLAASNYSGLPQPISRAFMLGLRSAWPSAPSISYIAPLVPALVRRCGPVSWQVARSRTWR